MSTCAASATPARAAAAVAIADAFGRHVEAYHLPAGLGQGRPRYGPAPWRSREPAPGSARRSLRAARAFGAGAERGEARDGYNLVEHAAANRQWTALPLHQACSDELSEVRPCGSATPRAARTLARRRAGPSPGIPQVVALAKPGQKSVQTASPPAMTSPSARASAAALPGRCSPAGRLRRTAAGGRPPRSRCGLRARPLRRRVRSLLDQRLGVELDVVEHFAHRVALDHRVEHDLAVVVEADVHGVACRRTGCAGRRGFPGTRRPGTRRGSTARR